MHKIICLFLLFVSINGSAQIFADKNYYLVDSLNLEELSESHRELIENSLKQYHSAKNDTSKVKAIEVIVDECWNEKVWPKYNLWVYDFSSKQLKKEHSSEATNSFRRSLAGATNNIGYYHGQHGEVEQQLLYYEMALAQLLELEDIDGVATVINNIGFLYFDQGKIPSSLVYYNKSLELREALGNKKGIAESLNNIAYVYDEQGDLTNSKEYYEKALIMFRELKDSYGIGAILNNLGYIYQQEKNYEKALKSFEEALIHKEKIEDKIGISESLNNIGYIHKLQGDYTKALDFFNQSLMYREEVQFKKGIAITLNNIGSVELMKGNFIEAEAYSKKSLVLAKELGYPNEIFGAAKVLSSIYEFQNKGMKALEMHKLFIVMQDSLQNEAAYKATVQQQTKYEYEKQKVADDAEYDKNIAIEKKEKEKQQFITYAIAGGLALVVFFLVFVFNRLRITKKQKIVIEKQKTEVETQKEVIEETHKEITDSINYAKRLQDAILPSFEEVNNHIANNFILFKPKDVVSGDFYWFEHIGDTSYLASADCTGHGVPGAMVSVVCSNALNRSVKEFDIKEPSKILGKTRELVIETFAKSGEGVKDGMDIALCAFKDRKVIFSGANNPLWIVREVELLTELQKEAKNTMIIEGLALIEFKANRQPVGLYEGMKDFTQQEIELFKGDNLYFFTDGFADQFGGEKGKKFKYKPFKKLLIELHSKSMDEQKEQISELFENWRGDLEQIDDVCVVGVGVR